MVRVRAHRRKGFVRRIRKRGRDKLVRVKGGKVKGYSRRKGR